jgi:hypothetical protein
MLGWLLVCELWRDRHVRQRAPFSCLDWIAAQARTLIILRAADFRTRPMHTQRLYGGAAPSVCIKRAVFGARARRFLRIRDWRDRIVRLVEVLRAIDVWAARIARRLHRGLTRLFARLCEQAPACAAPSCVSCIASAPTGADSS